MQTQLLPIVYIRNNTSQIIEDIYFSFDDIELMGSKAKKIKPNNTKNISIYLADRQKFQLAREDYDLVMHHRNENKYVVVECYGISPSLNILVEIMTVYKDGTLGIKVDEKFSRI